MFWSNTWEQGEYDDVVYNILSCHCHYCTGIKRNKGMNYWIMENEKRVYFIDNSRVGEEYITIKYLISNKRLSSSKAHKMVAKIKENKAKK
jgi:hypothetical protein